MRPVTERNISLWFSLATLALILVAALVFVTAKKTHDTQTWVTHTYEVIGQLQGVTADVIDVQSSQRGYVITGRREYLGPYSVAAPRIDERLTELRRLLADNPEQTKRLSVASDLIHARVKLAGDIIATYDAEGQQAAMARVAHGTGKNEMDKIRAHIAEMTDFEHTLLAARRQIVNDSIQLAIWLGAFGVALSLGILGAIFMVMRDENQRRRNTEASLQDTLGTMRQIAQEDQQLSNMVDYLQGCVSVEEAYVLMQRGLPLLLPGTHGGIAIFSNSRDRLETVVKWGDADDCANDFLPETCWGLRRGMAHWSHAQATEPMCEHYSSIPTGGALCLPMQAHGETVGLFYACFEKPDLLTDHVKLLARRAAEQFSLAISNLRLQHRLREQSIRDPLTGAFNRRYLEETLDREMARARRTQQPLSLLVMDVDHFKRFNDTMGHDAGDAVLAQFAQMLQKQIRKEDIACRFGGEEFVIVMPMMEIADAARRADDIRKATEDLKVRMGDKVLGPITVSIGVSSFPAHGNMPEELFSAADGALYEAKHNGRNRTALAKSAEDMSAEDMSAEKAEKPAVKTAQKAAPKTVKKAR
jgi:diguanylate cyclase (GGDEF)-like protein